MIRLIENIILGVSGIIFPDREDFLLVVLSNSKNERFPTPCYISKGKRFMKDMFAEGFD